MRAFALYPPIIVFVRLTIVFAVLLLPSSVSAQTPTQTPAQAEQPRQVTAAEPLECKDGHISGLGVKNTPAGLRLISDRVIIQCDGTQLFADEISWNDAIATAKGDVLVIQEGLRVNAERVEMDRKTKLATFFNASGTARLTEQHIEKSLFGAMEPEVTFAAKKIEKTGPQTYRLTEGWFSTCAQTPPRWEIVGSQGTITLDEHVLLKNAVFRVKGIPVLYLPVIYYPIGEDDRSSGFLLPTYSRSNITGQGISTAYFWAIDRSQDATIMYDWFSKGQQGLAGEYRFRSSPGSSGNAWVHMFDEELQLAADGSVIRPAHRSYEVRSDTSQQLRRFHLTSRVNYFTDVTTQQLYQQNLYDFSRRDRQIGATLTGNFRYARMQALFDQRDIYRTATQTERLGRLPQFNLWFNDRPIGRSPFTVGASTELAGIERQFNLDDPLTNRSLWRFDARPTIRGPLLGRSYLSVQAAAAMRFTEWSDSVVPATGQLAGSSLMRSLFDFSVDARGPVLTRTFKTPDNGYAESFRHSIEPRVGYSWFSPFDNRNQIVQNDTIDSIATGTATLSYGVDNVINAKVRRPGGGSSSREILRVSVNQSYYTDSRAAAVDTQYQTTTIGQFSNLTIRALVRPVDQWDARFQMYLDPKTFEPASYSAAAGLRGSVAQISGTWTQSRFRASPTDDHLTVSTHMLGANGAFKTLDGRFGGAYDFGLDVKNRQLLNQRYAFFYNAQCCGFGVEYQITNIEHLNQAEKYRRTFNFTFTLAGIGSFSNPMGAFKQ